MKVDLNSYLNFRYHLYETIDEKKKLASRNYRSFTMLKKECELSEALQNRTSWVECSLKMQDIIQL